MPTESLAPKLTAPSESKEVSKPETPPAEPTLPIPPTTTPPAETPKPESKPEPAKPSEEQPAPKPPATPATPPAEKVVDPVALFASLTPNSQISLHWRTNDSDTKSTLNLTVVQQTLDMAKHLRLVPAKNAPFAMFITVKASNTAEVFSVVLAAELKYNDSKGGDVVVWKQSKQVVSLDPRRIRPEQAVNALRVGTGNFFDKFVEDLRRARSNKVAPK